MARSEGMKNITQAQVATGGAPAQAKKEGIKQFQGLADQAMAKVTAAGQQYEQQKVQERQESLTAADRQLELDKDTGKYKPTDLRAAQEKAKTQAMEARSQMAAGEGEREENKIQLAQQREGRLAKSQQQDYALGKQKADVAQARLELDYQESFSKDRQTSLDARRRVIDKQTGRIDDLDKMIHSIGTKEGSASVLKSLGKDLENVAGADPTMGILLQSMRSGGGLEPEQADRLRGFIQSKKDNIILSTMSKSGIVLDSVDMTSPLMEEYNAYASNYKQTFESAMQMEMQIASQLEGPARAEYVKGTRWLNKTPAERQRHFRRATAEMFNYERSQRTNVGSDSQYFRGSGGQPPGAEQLQPARR